MKKICIFAVLTVLTLGLSGCEEDWYRPGFIGEWDLIEAGGFPVDSRYADAYDFYDNGTGVYYFVDDYGYLCEEWFRWDADEYTIHIVFDSYYMGTAFWYYDYDRYYLYLSDTPDMHYYYVYERHR